MSILTEKIELFHLLFLEQLSRHLSAQLYAIKGGCNLRFFHRSIRYSEDLDIDVQTIAVETLKNKVNTILKSTPFKLALKTHHLQIENISLPKQTATTQRWKLSLSDDSPIPLNTKIEVSRRGISKEVSFDNIDPTIIAHYKLMPILCSHYTPQAAFIQKVEAACKK